MQRLTQQSQRASATKFCTDFKWDSALTYEKQRFIVSRLHHAENGVVPEYCQTPREVQAYLRPTYELPLLLSYIEEENIRLASIEVNHNWFFHYLSRCFTTFQHVPGKKFLVIAWEAVQLAMGAHFDYLRKNVSTGLSEKDLEAKWLKSLPNMSRQESNVLHRFLLFDDTLKSLYRIHEPVDPDERPHTFCPRVLKIEDLTFVLFTQSHACELPTRVVSSTSLSVPPPP